MVLLFYIAFGALVQKLILKLTFIDALYLAVVSIETVGFGDVVPSTTGSRIFTMFYITFGILNLAVAVASVREVLLESIVVSLQDRIHAIKQRERQRRIRGRWRDAIIWRLRAQRLPVWIDRPAQAPRNLRLRRLHHRRLNIEALTTAQLEASALEAGAPLADLLPPGFVPFDSDPASWTPITPSVPDDGGHSPSPLTHIRTGRMVHLLASFALAVTHGEQALLLGTHPNPTYIDDDEEPPEESPGVRSSTGVPFSAASTLDNAALSTVLEGEETTAFRVRLAAALVIFLIFWMVGSSIFSRTEGWSFGIAVWFCFTTFTTVGYGDFSPKTAAGRSIFIVWALMGIGTMTILIAILSEAYSDRYKRAIRSQVYEKAILNTSSAVLSATSGSPPTNNSFADFRTSPTNADEKQPFLRRPRSISFASLPLVSENEKIGATSSSNLRKGADGKLKLKPPPLNLDSIIVQAGNRPFHDEVIEHVQAIQALLLTLPTDAMSQTTLTGIDRHLMEITNLMTVKALAS
ncbi:hypothetical protein EST38_g9025 [Candolleomyces aberdarensis]|uniref:Potassium channel domain-containing protein n=1 Tax=Candolleomyces aberdarensis TaxID=2316362 RepID=A0A4Q2DB07_9AGAR|nr:hypothetical protein EST38_g9025 [Candolleomyces aberdarensis]